MRDLTADKPGGDLPTILVVDDRQVSLEGVAQVLERDGYRVLTASDGDQALEMARTHRPRLILLDVVMPGLTGPEVLRRIKDDPRLQHISVMLMSSRQTASDEQASGLDLGAADYIARPVDNRELSARVRAQLRQLELIDRLRASEQRVREVLANQADAVLVVDLGGKVCFANREAERLFGTAAAQLVGADFGFPVVTGDKEEITIVTPSGKPLVAEMRVSDSVWEGRKVCVASLRDVTEHRLAEERMRASEARFRTLLEEVSSVSVQGYGLDGTVHYWNRASEILYGYPREEAIGGNLLELIIPPEMRDDVRDKLATVAATGENVIPDGELSLMRRDGSRVSVYSSHAVYQAPGGAEPELFCIDVDLTATKELQDQLAHAQRLESIGQLTGGIAHDFNNLLTVILGYSDLLERKLAHEPGLHRMASMIGQGARRAAELTHRLLAFARKQPLQPVLVDVNELVDGMRVLLQRTLEEHIEVEPELADDVWSVLLDAAQLESALLNLAINARDAMPAGGKLLIETCNTRLDDEYARHNPEVGAGEYVRIVVTDNGSGISREDLVRVFEPFFTTKEKGTGTGLGLAMVYGYVKQSGGHIKVYSEIGVGTSITMYFPRAVAETEQHDNDNAPMSSAQDPARGGSETLLVVEDEDMVREYARTQLESLGYRVLSAADGAEALELVREHAEVDLLFTDVVMPGGMTGRQLADAARRIRPGLRVLYTSGYTESAIVHHGRLDAGIRLLGKPYRRSALAACIREALDGRPDEPA